MLNLIDYSMLMRIQSFIARLPGDIKTHLGLSTSLPSSSNTASGRQNSDLDKCIEDRQFYQYLVNSLPMGILALDKNGVVVFSNDLAVSQLELEPDGRKWTDIIKEVFLSTLDSHDVAKHKNNKKFSVKTSPMVSKSGQVILLKDITFAQDHFEKDVQSRKMQFMGSMLASLAHQIRTPLTAAMLYASQRKVTENVSGNGEKILTSLKHIEHIINDILVYSARGKMLLNPICLSDVVEELSTLVQPSVKISNCRLFIVNDLDSQLILGNRNALLSALQNLVVNAVQACNGEGNVRMRIYQLTPETIEIMVSDNGCGISAEKQSSIFEPFVTNHAGGTGLGLAVVKAVAEKHKAELWVESLPGYGTTFGLVFPLYKKTSATESTEVNFNNRMNYDEVSHEINVRVSH